MIIVIRILSLIFKGSVIMGVERKQNSKHNESGILYNKVLDKIKIYEKTGIVTSTYFLTPSEIQEVMNIIRKYEHMIVGGYDEAERRIIIIGDENADLSEYLTIIRAKSQNQELSHRNVLGSVLGLGIKREMIGDIIVKDKICDIIIIQSMSEYILNNLTKIGSEKVEVKEVKVSELLKDDKKKNIKTISVASLRIDAVISNVYGISREKSSKLIEQEKVLINFLPCRNNSKSIKAEDIVSIRGYGRIKLTDVIRRN